jgi:hypothetical protein
MKKEKHKSPFLVNDVNFSANRLRKMWGIFDTRSCVQQLFPLSLAFRIGKMKAKEDNSRGKTWFGDVRDQNIGKAS